MLMLFGFALVIGALGFTLWDAKIPELSDWMERPAYANRKMARWSVRAMGINVLMLAGEVVIFIYSAWLGRVIITFGFVVAILGIRRLRRTHRKYLAYAQAEEDHIVDQTAIPDSPKGL